jgi:hypothetical protein
MDKTGGTNHTAVAPKTRLAVILNVKALEFQGACVDQARVFNAQCVSIRIVTRKKPTRRPSPCGLKKWIEVRQR